MTNMYLQSDCSAATVEQVTPVEQTAAISSGNIEDLETNKGLAPPQALPGMTTAHKIQWLLFNIAANNAIIVTLGYWCLLFPFVSSQYRSVEGERGFFNISVHLLNAVLMLIEISVSSLPVHLFHVIYAAIYGFIYLCMTLVYWLLTKSYIYYFLNFNNPGLALGFSLLLLVVVQPLSQLLYYGLYRLRGRLERRFRKSHDLSLPLNGQDNQPA